MNETPSTPEQTPTLADQPSVDPAATNPQKPRRNKKARRLIFFGIAVALTIGLIDVANTARTFYSKTKLTSERLVIVERGSTIQETAALMKELDVIVSDRVFILGAR
ncbi:MAG: hypothetical protein O2910_08530, partial [Proteobacteria bacterium]|nr:hypothetical protein [Pseudomonadota bacterium]